MICEKYEKMSIVDKILFTGELLHACMNDDKLFELGKQIIELGMVKGTFDGVQILPQRTDEIPMFKCTMDELNNLKTTTNELQK